MAVDYFLKIDGVPGESKDKTHKDTIDVLSWSWGESQSGSMAYGGGGGAGKVSMQDFHFTMRVNKATPHLIYNCASGKHIPKAVLTCRKAGDKQQEYLKYTFSDLLISSYQTGASGEEPIESVAFNYSKVEVEYKEQDAKGNLVGGAKKWWDLKQNIGG